MSDLTKIPNIGPATARSLIAAGIPDADTLRRAGAHEAYRALLTAGERPHFIGYYVLQMALQGRPWNDCRGAEKAALRVQFDALVAETRSTTPTGIEAELREIGLIAPQPPSRS
ncbi:MAG TPA: TfoX/Sxy family protein [Paracoccus sp. (in: a-proteobacteria)]|nr:TfoX/Sxy family protein [Paracoccus sp. (in: a-proteobacteria)]